MYSEEDINAAVATGTLTQEAADSLRAHAAGLRSTPSADEESFRLITSFNDIFVTLAGILVLISVAWIGGATTPVFGAITMAAVSWSLSEFFTLKRRMALPSIVFFITFVLGIQFAAAALFTFLGGQTSNFGAMNNPANISGGLISNAIVLGACWLHWRRFQVPITIAYGTVAIVGSAFSIYMPFAINGSTPSPFLIFLLIFGLAVFAFAMWWDMSDTRRTTRNSDVAFWLHLFASPMIVHPIFLLMGWNILGSGSSVPGPGLAIVAIALYCAFAIVALIIDRRAFLVSAMIYVLGAIIYLFSSSGVSGSFFPVAALIIGSGLLMMSAFWQRLRAFLLQFLPPHISSRLPATNR